MKRCDMCGNEYDKCMEITYQSKNYIFDSFECAIYHLAPSCNHCQCKIIGHGLEENNKLFCCANCAKLSGKTSLKDRA